MLSTQAWSSQAEEADEQERKETQNDITMACHDNTRSCQQPLLPLPSHRWDSAKLAILCLKKQTDN